MAYIYSASNSTMPVGKVMDYNNTNPSRGIAFYRLLSETHNPLNVQTKTFEASSFSFADAIYSGGPYSLLHPNANNSFRANVVDYLA